MFTMHSLLNVGLFILCVGLGFAINRFFDRFPCDCGRQRLPYFAKDHNKVWTMIFWAVIVTICVAVDFIDAVVKPSFSNDLLVVVFSLLAFYYWRGVWFHEKDKIKKAAKAAGRVFVNQHGRLKVANDA